MTSEKQIRANRKNSKLGGVKTEEGKAVSKLNALKHGLLSRENLMSGENQANLEDLTKKIIQDLKPIGALEIVLVDRIVVNIWRLKRAMRVEKEMLEQEQKNPFTDKETIYDYNFINDDMLNKFTRYETTIEKGIYKAIHELEGFRKIKSEWVRLEKMKKISSLRNRLKT